MTVFCLYRRIWRFHGSVVQHARTIKNVLGHQAYILESIKALEISKSYRIH